jgi:acyl dehydratase
MSDTTAAVGNASLRLGTWEEAQSWVGRELAVYRGADEVSVADIRRFLEVLALDAPIHYDDEVARANGYRTIPAPATFLMPLALPAYWSPGDPRPAMGDPVYWPIVPMIYVPAPGTGVMALHVDTEYHEPLYPGDRVHGVARLVSVTRKRLSVGDGAFMVSETTYRNQDDVLVGVEHLTAFRYVPVDEED